MSIYFWGKFMHLAIGDVVRHRRTGALGAVACIATHSTGKLVLMQSSEAADALCAEPCDLDVVARKPKPLTTTSHLVTLVFSVVAFVAAYVSGQEVQDLGAGLPVAFLTCFGTFTLVSSLPNVYRALTGPRRYRV